MPVAQYAKTTWAYYDPGFGDGWSETAYSTFTSVANHFTAAELVAEKRTDLLGYLQAIRYIRVSVVQAPFTGIQTLPGASQTLFYADKYQNKNPRANVDKNDNNPDNPWQAIKVQMLDATLTYRKTLYFRGVPDRIEVNPPGPIVLTDPDYNDAWKLWRTAYTNQQYGWFARTKIPQNIQPTTLVAYDPAGVGTPPQLVVTTAAAHGLTPGRQIRFIGGKVNPRLKGAYVILSVPSVTTFTVAVLATTAPIVLVNPTVRSVDYTLIVANTMPIKGECKHNTGRPFGRSLGRRKIVPRTV